MKQRGTQGGGHIPVENRARFELLAAKFERPIEAISSFCYTAFVEGAPKSQEEKQETAPGARLCP